MARVIGIDFGTKRVGIALSDEARQFAFPAMVLENTEHLVADVYAYMQENGADTAVIGESTTYAGSDNPVMAYARTFAAALNERGITIEFESEHLSSAHAKRQFEVVEKTRKPKESVVVDASAAALILEGYLSKARSRAHFAAKFMEPNTPVSEEQAVASSKISIDDFHKVEMRIGEIKNAELIEGADKLLKLTVDLGEEEPRQILSGIRAFFPDPTVLIGKRCPFVANLAPRTMRGLESNGMIVAVSTDDAFSLLEVPATIPPGTKLK
jgi:putative transcription antitermination factor YqgF